MIPDFDEESVSPCSPTGGAYRPQHAFFSNATSSLRKEREAEGHCSECGIQTHELRHNASGEVIEKSPLTIIDKVHRGRCLFCFPFADQSTSSQSLLGLQSSQLIDKTSIQTEMPLAGVSSFHGLAHVGPDLPDEIIRDRSEDVFEILFLMRLYSFEEKVQEQGCERLWVHSWDDETAASIGRVGGIPRIIQAMLLFPNNSSLQRSGCEILQNLAVNSFNRSIIVDQGGAALIVQAMMRNLDCAGMQQCGCIGLASLASSPELRGDILRSGAAQAVILASRRFTGDEMMYRAAYQALLALGCDEPCRYIPEI